VKFINLFEAPSETSLSNRPAAVVVVEDLLELSQYETVAVGMANEIKTSLSSGKMTPAAPVGKSSSSCASCRCCDGDRRIAPLYLEPCSFFQSLHEQMWIL
jgi:hypothetical protein